MPAYEILYISELSPATSTITLEEIPVEASEIYKSHGTRFIHLLEGDQTELVAVMTRIASDDRRVGDHRMHHNSSAKRRLYRFGIDYWYVEDDSSIARLRPLVGRTAIGELLASRAEFRIVNDPKLTVAAVAAVAPLSRL